MRLKRWVVAGAASVAATVVAFVLAAQSMSWSAQRDWSAKARAAAIQSILERAPDPTDVRFADVEVRITGNDDERWVCGSFAVWSDEGTLSPHRDFWVTVVRTPGTRDHIAEVRPNMFGRDDFFDRDSAHYQACFDIDTG